MSDRRNDQDSALSGGHASARFESYPYGDSTFICGCGWRSPHMPTREDALVYGMEHFRTIGGFTVNQKRVQIR